MTDDREDLNIFKLELVKQARWWQLKAKRLEVENNKLEFENVVLREILEILGFLREN